MSNFLGKKISLISKALIRYEGVLYTIDQSAFTVALSKVKSFGTEDRPAERFIAAREEVYEYIIFRGSDISDLHVCENSVFSDDSAIVKVMSPNITNTSSPPASASQLRGINNDINPIDSISHFQEPISPESQPTISISKRFTNISKVSNNRKEDSKEDYFNKSQNEVDMPFIKNFDNEDLEEIAAKDYRQFKNREQTNKSDSNYEQNDENHQYSYYRRPSSRRGFRSGNTRGYMSATNRGRQKDVPQECLIKDDFDFESSNALIAEELAKLEVSHSNIPGNISHVGGQENNDKDDKGGEEGENIFYDKSKSFFDNISSEVSDRTGNTTGDRSRRNNIETFGSSEYSRGGNKSYRGSKWNGNVGAYRENYCGPSTGFMKRGGNSRRGEARGGRTRFSQRRPFSVNGMSGFREEN